jgi:hypothetical protein
MKTLFLISCLFIAGLVSCQPVSKLYAFSQEHTPGMIPEGEMGGSRNRTQYFIYVTQSVPSAKIQFTRIRINNQWYKVNTVDTLGSPVYLEQPEKKLLVPRTRQLVLQLNLGETASAPFRAVSTKAKASVYYIYKRKNYTVSCMVIQKLPAFLGL